MKHRRDITDKQEGLKSVNLNEAEEKEQWKKWLKGRGELPSLKTNTWEGYWTEEATVTDYFPHTQGRDGVFFVSESLREKSLHSHHGDANTFHVVSHALTHSYTYLSDRTWLCTYFSINPPKNKQRPLPPLLPLRFFLVFLSSPAFLLSFLPSVPVSLFLSGTRSERSHADARIPTHALLSPVTSRHLLLSLPSLTHAHTRSGSSPTSTPQEAA